MTIFKIQDQEIINGICPEIPEGTTEVDLSGCYELETIPKIPGTVKKLDLAWCGSLEVSPEIPEGVEEIDFSNCIKLETITNIPETVQKLNLEKCERLQALPAFAEGVEEINLFGCKSLKIIPNIPATVTKLNFGGCFKLKALSEIPEGVEEINLLDCKRLTTIPNLPETIKKLNLGGWEEIRILPILHEGIEEIDLSDCYSLETISDIPRTVKKLNLQRCERLSLTLELITRLEELEEQECEIIYPEHFNPDILSAKAKEKLAQITKNYREENPDQTSSSSSITTVLNRFLTEGIGQRSEESNQEKRAREIAQSTLPILEILEKNPHLLPLVDKIAGEFLAGCINQPVRGWSEVAALMAIAAQSDISDRLEETKQIFTLDYIAGFVSELPEDQKVGKMFEVEAGNALYREVHKMLVGNKTLKEPWLGVPGPISYEQSIRSFLTEERIQSVTERVQSQIISLPKETLAQRICESQHNQAWGEICFFEEVKEINEYYAKQRADFAKKDSTQFTEQDIKELKKIDLKQAEDLVTKIREKTFDQLARTNSGNQAEEFDRSRIQQESVVTEEPSTTLRALSIESLKPPISSELTKGGK